MSHAPLARVFTALALLACAAGSGCGGGGGSEGDATLTFQPSTDITVVSNGSPGGTALTVGDLAGGVTDRAALRFGISPFISSTATVVSAKLRLNQNVVVGDPYGLLGTIVVDRVDFGLSLNDSDFAPTVLTPNIGTLSNAAANGVKEVDVTAAVQADVTAGAFTSDFLVRFTTDLAANGNTDAAIFEDSENTGGSNMPPLLIVVVH